MVSLGARGCIARGRHNQVGACPAPRVQVEDTIGAGDYFTSGFLYAYLHGCNLQQCAVTGCSAGAEAVQTQGALLSEAAWQRLRVGVAGAVAAAGSKSSSSSRDGACKQVMATQQQQQQQCLVNGAAAAAAGGVAAALV